jgi:hypothetical protein
MVSVNLLASSSGFLHTKSEHKSYEICKITKNSLKIETLLCLLTEVSHRSTKL